MRVGRMVILSAIIIFIFVIFVLQLMQLQIVKGSEYANEIMQGKQLEFFTTVARGEILDSTGESIVSNRTGYNIQFYYAYLNKENQNKIILELTELMTQTQEEWIDTLPITKTAPFEFLSSSDEETEKSIAELKDNLGKQQFATIDNVIDGLIETFEISRNYSPEDMRIIAGVRYEMLKSGFGATIPYTFAEDISKDTMIIVKERSKMWSGVSTIEAPIRDYTGADIAPHIIGNIGKLFAEEYEEKKTEQDKLKEENPDVDMRKFYTMNDFIGKSGIESVYESELKGTRGIAKVEFDSNGHAVGNTHEIIEEPIPGNSVKLTFDAKMQQLAFESYAKNIKRLNDFAPEGEGKEAKGGSVVVLDVQMGNILAMVTFPTYTMDEYKNNYTSLSKDKLRSPLENRSTRGLYAPGSTFKPMMSIAGLLEGVITDESTYLCTGRFHYLSYSPGCLGAHGNATVYTALRRSCNIFYYNTGLALGIDKIDEYAKAFGLGEKTGIELDEKIGHRSNPYITEEVLGEVWNPGDVIQTSIGQSKNMFTPLQLANYTATIARNGVLMETHIVDSILSYNRDEVIKKTEPVVISKLENKNDAFTIVKEGMRQASAWGGTAGSYLGNYPIPIASKTGTPETSGLVNSVFICFAPIEKPEIAIAVVIEHGWHGYTGAPVARDIFDAYFFDDYNIYD